MKQVKIGDWIKLSPNSSPARIRIEVNGQYWIVEAILDNQLKLRSAERTFGPPKEKRYDGMVIWAENDPNYEWSL